MGCSPHCSLCWQWSKLKRFAYTAGRLKSNMKFMKLNIFQIMGMLVLLLLPVSGNGADLPPTTRQQTVRPLALPADTRQISPKDVPLYKLYGYSAWQLGPGVDEGRKFNLMPAGYTGATNAARLLSFFSMSDVHINDKESPAQLPWFGWSAPFGGGGLFVCAYSPIIPLHDPRPRRRRQDRQRLAPTDPFRFRHLSWRCGQLRSV